MDDEKLSKFIYPSHILSELLFWSPSLIHIFKKMHQSIKEYWLSLVQYIIRILYFADQNNNQIIHKGESSFPFKQKGE